MEVPSVVREWDTDLPGDQRRRDGNPRRALGQITSVAGHPTGPGGTLLQ
jgi:hypothetical protein